MSFSEVMSVLESLQHTHMDKSGMAMEKFRTGVCKRQSDGECRSFAGAIAFVDDVSLQEFHATGTAY